MEWAGGKGANLARLCRLGFNVPPGFIVTAPTFHHFLSCLDIPILSQRRDWNLPDLERIREFLLACPFPDHLARPILHAYKSLPGPCAVRSSMVGEDTPTASFAGQLDSTLNITSPTALLAAIQRCWASLFYWHLLRYLEQQELASPPLIQHLAIAVIVQQMVQAEAAGVAFSANPLSGEPCVIIEAVHGLGDALVQGRAIPHRYVVDPRGVLTEQTGPPESPPPLNEAQALHLAATVRRVATAMKAPQDVEWAWDGQTLYLLQTRPITSLVGRRIYSSKIVSEMSPGLVKPLLWSTNTVTMAQNVFGRIFTELIGPSEVDFSHLVRRIHSRVYADITLFSELFERVGLPVNFFEMLARDERAQRRHPSLTGTSLRALVRLLRFAWRHARPADEISAFIERHRRELEPYRRADWSSAPPHELLARYEELANLHRETQWFVFIGPINMMIRNRLLDRLVRQHAPKVIPSDLIRGLVGLKALEPNQELRRLAAQARSLGDQALTLLTEGDDPTIRTILSRSEDGRALVQEMDRFLERYGFLSASGTDFSTPPWRETPTLIWHAIGRIAANPEEPAHEKAEAIRAAAQKRVRSHIPWAQRWLFDRLLNSTTTYIDLRERTSLLMSEDSYQMRRIFLVLAEHLVAIGALRTRDDIFLLTYEEIRRLVEGTLPPEAVRQQVIAREAELEADAGFEAPEIICGEPTVPTTPVLPVHDQECLVGISGSSGLAQGPARIVLDPTRTPADLNRSDILVVPFTDVGWTPLFCGIGGIVAETGGQLSHTAIVAREYGLPAVVSVKKATQLIRDGQWITVDGYHGKVYLRPK